MVSFSLRNELVVLLRTSFLEISNCAKFEMKNASLSDPEKNDLNVFGCSVGNAVGLFSHS